MWGRGENKPSPLLAPCLHPCLFPLQAPRLAPGQRRIQPARHHVSCAWLRHVLGGDTTTRGCGQAVNGRVFRGVACRNLMSA